MTGEFGYRLLADEARDAGEGMSDRSAWRIASTNGWFSAFGKPKRGKSRRPRPPVLVTSAPSSTSTTGPVTCSRQTHRTSCGSSTFIPPQAGGTPTEHKTGEGTLYCCAIKDAFSARIVGYSIDPRMKSRLAVQALENAVAMRGNVAGCIVHSDRGSQFRNRKFLRALARARMVASMETVGSSGDNAAMESSFALLQKNVLNRHA